MRQDSSRPEFWDSRFRDGVTPWDAGGVPPALKDWVGKRSGRLRVLIPGRKADFFAFEGGAFDLVYERAFLCALPRRLWPDWARRVKQLTRTGGELVGFFYLDDMPAEQSLPVFNGKEHWQVWKRPL